MFWLVWGIGAFFRAFAGAVVVLFAAIGWSIRSFAALSPKGKIFVVIGTIGLSFVLAQFDVPLLEPQSPESVVDQYVRPGFDPHVHDRAQALQEESERTKEFPLYEAEMCDELLSDGPGAEEYWRAFSVLSDRPLTYRDALTIIDSAQSTSCYSNEVGARDFARVRRISGNSRILFD